LGLAWCCCHAVVQTEHIATATCHIPPNRTQQSDIRSYPWVLTSCSSQALGTCRSLRVSPALMSLPHRLGSPLHRRRRALCMPPGLCRGSLAALQVIRAPYGSLQPKKKQSGRCGRSTLTQRRVLLLQIRQVCSRSELLWFGSLGSAGLAYLPLHTPTSQG
jgi:hypothetical protein